MSDKSKYIIITALILLLGLAAVFYGKKMFSSVSSRNTTVNKTEKDSAENTAADVNPNPFFVSGWIPYWEKEKGAASIQDKLDYFSEINPFAFAVNPDGSLFDKAKIDVAPWPELFKNAQEKNVRVVPTVLWGDAEAMHNVFTDPALLEKHIEAVSDLLKKYDFPGVDIDYEGKDVADRDNFSLFLKSLSEKLKNEGRSINCTVEARSDDSPPAGFLGTKAMSWANDFSVLNKYCDSVRIMAYDEVFQVHREKKFEEPDPNPSAPNAENQWVEQVIKYALRYIAPEKLVLGVPTYGWEFQFQKTSDGFQYSSVGSISYPDAVKKASLMKKNLMRTNGGELFFTYNSNDGEHIVTFEDAESIGQKIEIAKKYNLEGISLFKIDGLYDPSIYTILDKILSK